jgi:hypothetical protein
VNPLEELLAGMDPDFSGLQLAEGGEEARLAALPGGALPFRPAALGGGILRRPVLALKRTKNKYDGSWPKKENFPFSKALFSSRDSSTRFSTSGFFNNRPYVYEPLIHSLKYFRILYRIREDILKSDLQRQREVGINSADACK